MSQADGRPPRGTRFPETSWGLVRLARAAAGSDNPAFAELYRRYQLPIHACLRRQGCDANRAEDLTQAFFLELIEHDTVARADPERGRFRSFLQGSLRRFVAGELEHAQAWKRGAGVTHVSLDMPLVENQLADEAALPPDLLFDRVWAEALVGNALAILRGEYATPDQARWFRQLQPCLELATNVPRYADLAQRLDSNKAAVKTAIHRLRARFREVLRREVAATVASAADVDDEMRYLRDVLSAEVPVP